MIIKEKVITKYMRIFNIDKNTEVVCGAKYTRSGFKDEATLLVNGREVESTKICYLNRTWKRYTYESVISKVLAKAGYKQEKIQKIIDKFAREALLCNYEDCKELQGFDGEYCYKHSSVECKNKDSNNNACYDCEASTGFSCGSTPNA